MNDKVQNINNIEIEKKVLGILINSKSARHQKLMQIKVADFLIPKNQIVFQAILELATNIQKDFDLLILADFLKKEQKILKTEVDIYLTEITESFISDQFLSQYLKTLVDNAVIAQIKQQLSGWNTFLVSKSIDPAKFLQQMDSQIQKLSDFHSRNQIALKPLSTIVRQVVENWKQFQSSSSIVSCTTGFAALDEKTHGFQKGDLIILAARPSMGKTALALKMAVSNSLEYQTEDKGDVIIFSLEMSSYQLVQRILYSHLSQVNLRHLKETDYQKINEFNSHLEKANVFVDTSMTIDVHSIGFKLRSWIKKRPIKLVIIDYLQLLKPVMAERFDNRNLEVSHWTRILKEIARELEIPVLCLSQLSRYVEKRDDKRPLLSDLRDSGSIEQDADLVLFLYREDYYQKKEIKSGEKKDGGDKFAPTKAEVIIAKHRNGPTGVVPLLFIPSKVTFYEYSE